MVFQPVYDGGPYLWVRGHRGSDLGAGPGRAFQQSHPAEKRVPWEVVSCLLLLGFKQTLISVGEGCCVGIIRLVGIVHEVIS